MQEPTTTKMVSPEAPKVKMVRIRALQDIRLNGETVVKAGTVTEATAEEAKEFCDREFSGHTGFSGERHIADGDAGVRKFKRAERV